MKKWKFFAGLIAAIAILCRPETAVLSAQRAMGVWYASVAPALFPFLALMPLLTGPEACAVYEAVFGRIMRPVFHLPGSAAPAMMIGMISGSPGGAIGLSRIAAQTSMKKSELRRLAPVVCGVGPAYLIMGVGLGLYGSVELGARLAAVQLIAQILMLLILRFKAEDDGEIVTQTQRQSGGMIRDAVEAVLSVCGYMVFFAVAAGVLATFLGESVGKILLLMADLPSGMAALADWPISGRFVLMGLAVGFGGICIAAQNMDALGAIGVTWRDFLTVKFAQSALCAALSAFLLEDFRRLPPQNSVQSSRPFAFSLLIALILCLPALISLSKNLFLNKMNSSDAPAK